MEMTCQGNSGYWRTLWQVAWCVGRMLWDSNKCNTMMSLCRREAGYKIQPGLYLSGDNRMAGHVIILRTSTMFLIVKMHSDLEHLIIFGWIGWWKCILKGKCFVFFYNLCTCLEINMFCYSWPACWFTAFESVVWPSYYRHDHILFWNWPFCKLNTIVYVHEVCFDANTFFLFCKFIRLMHEFDMLHSVCTL